jgi:acyl carrier protein
MNTSLASRIRNVIAGHFRIAPGSLPEETRFRDDLGADWLDRLELLITIEDQVIGFEIDSVMTEQIETVGDLMRVVENADKAAGSV